MTYLSEREILEAGANFTVGKVNGVHRVSLEQEQCRTTHVFKMVVGIYFNDGKQYKAPISYGDWIQFVREAAASMMGGE